MAKYKTINITPSTHAKLVELADGMPLGTFLDELISYAGSNGANYHVNDNNQERVRKIVKTIREMYLSEYPGYELASALYKGGIARIPLKVLWHILNIEDSSYLKISVGRCMRKLGYIRRRNTRGYYFENPDILPGNPNAGIARNKNGEIWVGEWPTK